ncbi:MAG: trehalose-phosphatase [Pseudonocardiales bacterium]|nr:trehalose-phosphatase [Pseudonocardiales bacterium]
MIDLSGLGAAPQLLVALDFDGTLSPLIDVPADARALPEALTAVEGLAALPGTTVVLLSGRALASLAAVSGLGPPVRLVGSHGFEPDDGAIPLDDEQRARLVRLHDEIDALVDGTPGVRVERKPAGMAVHVRGAAPEVGARMMDAVRTGPAARTGIITTPGKDVLDLAVTDMSKGVALDRLRGDAAVFFAGDDVTDETAFVRLRPGDVGVKVGQGETAAGHRVADPAELAALLEELLAARAHGAIAAG